ncbi:MAG: hypothetical protein K9K93_01450 [Acholeplasmataceae bacterium]|nr:hypothetical protein [Acholeplasmataceae bacterium]
MRHALTLTMLLSLFGVLFACVPIDAPPEEVNWLSLNGSLMSLDSSEKQAMLSGLTIGSDGIRHLETDLMIEGDLSASFSHQDINGGVQMSFEEAPIRLEHTTIYDLDLREDPVFTAFLESSGVFEDTEGLILDNGVTTSFDYIVNTYANLENHYHHYNFLAFYDALSISMSDRQVKPFESEATPLALQALYDEKVLEILSYIQSDLLEMDDYLDVYDLRYGHRYEFNMTPLDFLMLRSDPVIGYTFDDETSQLMLKANLYVRENELILIRLDIEDLSFVLDRTLETDDFMGITLDGPFRFEGTASLSLVLSFHAEDPELPLPAYFDIYRQVESFRVPSIGHFLIDT